MMRRWRAWRSRERAPRRWGQRVLAVLSGLGVAYVLYLVLGFFLQRAAYFPGQFLAPSGNGTPPRGVEVLWRDIGGGERVEAWLSLPRGASRKAPAPLVIYLHGNAEFIDDNTWVIDIYRRMGLAVLLVEYRGYGRSGGSPSEEAIVGDILAFLDLARAREAVDGERLVVHGRSVGAGLAARVVKDRSPEGVIVQSAFTSMKAMLLRYGVPPVLVRDPMRLDLALAAHEGPVLIMHGSSDSLIPIAHAHRLRSLAQDASLLEGDGDHNDLPTGIGEYCDAIERYLDRAGVLGRATP